MAITDLIPWRRQVPTYSTTPLVSLQREMSRVLDELWGNGGTRLFPALGERMTSFFPEIDISETEKTIELTAELPGMKEKEIKLDVSRDGDTVTIEGEKHTESETREGAVYCAERRFGRFRRTVALPTRVDPDKVEARYRDGVLRIEMSKAADGEQSMRRIAVKAG